MKLKVLIGILLSVPIVSFADIVVESRAINEITISGESCDKDLRALIGKHCKFSNSKNIKEIYKDSFSMRTNAENSFEEWFVYSDFMGRMYSIKRYTDFNEQRDYGDYCYISLTCLE